MVCASPPATGVCAPAARAVTAGQRLALRRPAGGGRAGRALVELNTARAGEGPWSPERVNANAERAADDPEAIAYLGELAYGASAVSVPITNHAQRPSAWLVFGRRLAGQIIAGPPRVRLVIHDEPLAATQVGGGLALWRSWPGWPGSIEAAGSGGGTGTGQG